MREASIAVRTPEQVSVKFPLAGIGTRAIAHLIDTVILLIVYVLLTIGAVVWNWTHVFGGALPYVIGFLILTGFLLLWAYFIVFETVWTGRTPGKRLLGIRTIAQDGRPASFFAVTVRNLLRLVDFLPTGYLLGVVVMFIDGRERRIGDLAAGTVVVLDTRAVVLAPILQTDPSAARDADAADEPWEVTTNERKHRFSLVIHGPLPGPQTELLKTFVARERGMSRVAREQMIGYVWSQLLATGIVDVIHRPDRRSGHASLSEELNPADLPLQEKAALLLAVARAERTRQFGD